MSQVLFNCTIVPAAPGFKLIFQASDDPDDLRPMDDVVAWRIETRKDELLQSLVSDTFPLTVEGETNGGLGVQHPDGQVTEWHGDDRHASLTAFIKARALRR